MGMENEKVKIIANEPLKPVFSTQPTALNPNQHVRSTINGEIITTETISTHLKDSLITHPYKEQRPTLLSKIRETTKCSEDEIATNLSLLAKKRPDLFANASKQL